jgi:hypothetical protein
MDIPRNPLIKLVTASLVFAALLLGFFAASSAQGDDPGGYVPAFPDLLADSGRVAEDGCMIRFEETVSGPCVYGNPKSKKVVVLFGDSHALHWSPAFLRIAERRGWKLIALLKANCTSALADIRPACNQWRRNSLDRMRKIRPSLVVIATNTSFNVRVSDGMGGSLTRPKSGPALEAGMVETMRKMLRIGAKVTLIRDLFVPPFHPSACVESNPDNPELCSFDAARQYWMSFDYKAARRVKRVQVIDPLNAVCPGGTCEATAGRILKYRDISHFTATYAASITSFFGRRIQKP